MHTIATMLTDEAFVALQSTAGREGISHTDIINRAVTQYAVASALPVGKVAEVTAVDGATIRITRQAPQ